MREGNGPTSPVPAASGGATRSRDIFAEGLLEGAEGEGGEDGERGPSLKKRRVGGVQFGGAATPGWAWQEEGGAQEESWLVTVARN